MARKTCPWINEIRSKTAVCHPDRKTASLDMCSSCYAYFRKHKLEDSDKARTLRRIMFLLYARIEDAQRMWDASEVTRLIFTGTRATHEETDRRREQMLRSRYGITSNDYDLLLDKQKNACGLCGKEQTIKRNRGRLHVDHRHDNFVIRGLLCSKCNNLIGRIDSGKLDNPAPDAAAYAARGALLAPRVIGILHLLGENNDA